MSTTKLLAKHFKEVYFGGNWTSSNLKETLDDITVDEANFKIADFNTILCLSYHIHYFVVVQTTFLKGLEVKASDKLSFNHPEINDEIEWQEYKNKLLNEAAELIQLLEKLDDDILLFDFIAPQYGNYFRNINGLIEHTHYHLGQINLIKKLARIQTF
jgi:hypothetical protein